MFKSKHWLTRGRLLLLAITVLMVSAPIPVSAHGAQTVVELGIAPDYPTTGSPQSSPITITFASPTSRLSSWSRPKIEVANLEREEVIFLGNSMRQVIANVRRGEDNATHRFRLAQYDASATKIEGATKGDIVNIIREPETFEAFMTSLATDLAKELGGWAVGAGAALITSPPVLIAAVLAYPASKIAEWLTPILTERLTMRNIGTLRFADNSKSGTLVVSLIYDRKAGEAMVNVDFFPARLASTGSKVDQSPSETIFSSIRFKRILWDENAGSTIPVFPRWATNEIDWSKTWLRFKNYTSSSTAVIPLYVHDGSASGPVIAGALVTGQDGAGNTFSQTSNPAGYVTIAGQPGTWNFNVSKSGYQTNAWSQVITTTETRHAYLQPVITAVTLTLYVHDGSASGPVIAGALVTGQDGAGNTFSQTSNPAGYVTIAGQPGTWNFNVSKSGYQTNAWSQVITTTETRHAYLQPVITAVTLTLYVHDGSASGPVIAGALVTGQDGAGNTFSQTSNPAGYVTIAGQPGTWNFNVSKSGYQTNAWSQVITTTETRHAYLQPVITAVTLTLYVHDGSASGPVIAGALVTGQDGAGNTFSQTSNPAGYVTIAGQPGTWNFNVSKSGYQTNAWSQVITTTETRHAYLLTTVVAPQIISISPSQPIVNLSRQWLTINGRGFVSGSQVTLSIGGSNYLIPADRTVFISSAQIQIYVGLTDVGVWSAQITNPGGIQSNIYFFQVRN